MGDKYLTDADDDIEELTEEEAKGVFVELVVDMLTVVGHQLPLLLPRALHHAAGAASDEELHHAALHAQPDAPGDVEQDSLDDEEE